MWVICCIKFKTEITAVCDSIDEVCLQVSQSNKRPHRYFTSIFLYTFSAQFAFVLHFFISVTGFSHFGPYLAWTCSLGEIWCWSLKCCFYSNVFTQLDLGVWAIIITQKDENLQGTMTLFEWAHFCKYSYSFYSHSCTLLTSKTKSNLSNSYS